jgi:hypothetical protein
MRIRLITAAAALLATLITSPPAYAQSAADVENARQLFREALALSKEKRWDEAIPIYERSLALKEEPITLYSLGVAYKNTGRSAEALESLRQFLAKASNPKTERFQESAKAAVAELEPIVAHVTINVEPTDVAGLEVHIDDRQVPLAGLGLPRLIDPGPRTVTARAPGFHEASAAVELESGASGEVSLTLEPLPDTDDPAPTPLPVPQGPDRPVEEEGFPIIPVVIAGAGVAVLGAGVAVGMIGYSDAKDAPTRDGEEADAARTKMLAGDIVVGVGGAIAAGGVAWLLYELLTGPDEPGDVQAIAPWSDGTSAGVRIVF